jgi:flavin reductase (DIM6/NTAB) family NADH-FMN oxidoreductase RutF
MPSPVTDTERPSPMPAGFREAMRRVASSVMIVTSRDTAGQPHGMAASSVIPVSMDPPSMLVAVNRDASLHPVLLQSQRLCINLLADHQHHLLAPFSQTALRAQRFRSDDWASAWSTDTEQLPWLPEAPAVIDCAVDLATDYGTHTLFVGRVLNVHCTSTEASVAAPLVWLAGQRASLAVPA